MARGWTNGQISVENPSRIFNRRIYQTIGIRHRAADRMATIVAEVKSMLKSRPDIDLSRTLIVNISAFDATLLVSFLYTFTGTTNRVEFNPIKQDVLLKILEIIHANSADAAFATRPLHLEKQIPESRP